MYSKKSKTTKHENNFCIHNKVIGIYLVVLFYWKARQILSEFMLTQVWQNHASQTSIRRCASLVNIKIQLSLRTPLSFGKSIPWIYRRSKNGLDRTWIARCVIALFPIKPKRLNLKLPVRAIIGEIYFVCLVFNDFLRTLRVRTSCLSPVVCMKNFTKANILFPEKYCAYICLRGFDVFSIIKLIGIDIA